MQFNFGAVIALGATLVAAQSVGDLPQCSLQCFLQFVPQTGCDLMDFKCQCTPDHQNQLRSNLTPCVLSNCPNSADQQKVIQVTDGICAQNGGGSQSSGAAGGSPTPAPGGNSTSGGAGGSPSGTTSSSSSIVLGPQASYFTAAAQPKATAGSYAGAVIAVAGMALL